MSQLGKLSANSTSHDPPSDSTEHSQDKATAGVQAMQNRVDGNDSDIHTQGSLQPGMTSRQVPTACGTDSVRPPRCQRPGTLTIEDVSRHITQQQVSVWDYLRDQLHQHKVQIDDETAQQLPFDFWGGYMGYLGYELKAECGGDNVHRAATPDAAMFLADRYLDCCCFNM